MTTLDAGQAHVLSRFGECEAQLAGSSPAWLAPIRRAAIERFAGGLYRENQDAWAGVGHFERSHRALELAAVFDLVRNHRAGCHVHARVEESIGTY